MVTEAAQTAAAAAAAAEAAATARAALGRKLDNSAAPFLLF